MTEQIINREGIDYKLINLEYNTYRYYISKCAKVWDIDREVEVRQVLTGKPQYKYVNMTLRGHPKGRVLRRVHNLNLRTYVELPDEDNKYYVDHIDRDKLNNHLDNLRWVTGRENLLNQDRSLNKRLTMSGLKYHFPELADGVTTLNGLNRIRNLGRLEKLPKGVDYIDFELLGLCCEEVLKPKPYVYKDKELFYKSVSHPDYLKLLHDDIESEKLQKRLNESEKLQKRLNESEIEYKGEKYLSLSHLYKNMIKDVNLPVVSQPTFVSNVKDGLPYSEAIKPKMSERVEVKDGKTLRELHQESGVEWNFYVTQSRYNNMNRNQTTTITWNNIFVTKPRIRSYKYKGKRYKRIELCELFNLSKFRVSKNVNFNYPLGQYMLDRGITEGEFVIPIY